MRKTWFADMKSRFLIACCWSSLSFEDREEEGKSDAVGSEEMCLNNVASVYKRVTRIGWWS